MQVKRIYRLIIILSSVLIMMTAGVLFYYFNYNPKMIVKKYLYKDKGIAIQGNYSGLSIQNAMKFYKAKKYDKSWIVLNGLLQNNSLNDTLLYYNGVVLVKLNNWDEAVPYFEKVASDTNSVFNEQANYYLGLMYWYQGESVKARPIFDKFANQPDSQFRNLAKQIINQL